jgi:hypothetical protein
LVRLVMLARVLQGLIAVWLAINVSSLKLFTPSKLSTSLRSSVFSTEHTRDIAVRSAEITYLPSRLAHIHLILHVQVVANGMRYRRIPDSELVVSELGLGTMNFGDQLTKTSSIALLDLAVKEYAINFVVRHTYHFKLPVLAALTSASFPSLGYCGGLPRTLCRKHSRQVGEDHRRMAATALSQQGRQDRIIVTP